MRHFALIASAAIALSGCEQVSQIEAVAACTEKLESVFPAAEGLSDEDFEEIEGFGNSSSAGGFNFVVPATNGSQYWSCRGDWKLRRIYELSFKGVPKTPANAEYWSY